ncbi:MAG: quinone-dependent dihydroorotate dehydrogenase [Pseudohongiellaceae bacterium]
MYYKLLRNLLFCLPAEASHDVALRMMNVSRRLRLNSLLSGAPVAAEEQKRVMGLTFANCVGLAAGLDKNADYIDALAGYGFGFIEVGTLTPRPQPGNSGPRLFRLRDEQAIINRMGFNNKGIDHAVSRIQRSRFEGVLGINIGKNFDTPVENAAQDYLTCLRKAFPFAGYITVNLSSPNTPGLRSLQSGEQFKSLLGALKEEQAKLGQVHGVHVPLVIKLAPDLDESELQEIADAVLQLEVDGVIATNTTLGREGVKNSRYADETGGLSGVPLRSRSTEVIKYLARALGDRVPVIGCGGIFSGGDAREKIEAGAALVQVYTGFIYRGPALINEIRSVCGSEWRG